ncbi:hypothetical protein ACJX0J_008573, partial [Zea mays]
RTCKCDMLYFLYKTLITKSHLVHLFLLCLSLIDIFYININFILHSLYTNKLQHIFFRFFFTIAMFLIYFVSYGVLFLVVIFIAYIFSIRFLFTIVCAIMVLALVNESIGQDIAYEYIHDGIWLCDYLGLGKFDVIDNISGF